MSLDFAIKVAGMINDEVPDRWIDISNKIKIPFDDVNQVHLEFDGYHGQQIKQVRSLLVDLVRASRLSLCPRPTLFCSGSP
jgi:trehalose/maltose hydrolase-like predicted phosphorylase